MAKRILSIALALALGLALLIPAMAVEPADPYAPIITRQPGEFLSFDMFTSGSKLNLMVDAQLPADVTGTLSYVWYEMSSDEPVATGQAVTITADYIDDGGIFKVFAFCEYYAIVTNTYIDEDDAEQTASVQSDAVSITILNRLGAGLASIWFGNFFVSLLIFPLSMFNTVGFIFDYFLVSLIAVMYSFLSRYDL